MPLLHESGAAKDVRREAGRAQLCFAITAGRSAENWMPHFDLARKPDFRRNVPMMMLLRLGEPVVILALHILIANDCF